MGCELDWAVDHRMGKTPRDVVFKVAFSAALYHIWKGKGTRVFQQKSIDSQRVYQLTISNITVCLVSMKNVPTFENRRIGEAWEHGLMAGALMLQMWPKNLINLECSVNPLACCCVSSPLE